MTLDCTCNRLIEAERKAALWDMLVRGCDCALFERCPMRKGDGSCFCWQGRRREDA